MKKQSLIVLAVLLTLILSGVAILNWNTNSIEHIAKKENPVPEMTDQNMFTKESKTFSNFVYGVGTRFSPVKKSKIASLTSIEELIEDGGLEKMTSVTLSRLTIYEKESLTFKKAESNSAQLSKSQVSLLNSFQYSTNFEARIEFKETDDYGNINMDYRTPHLTVVPEIQAEYVNGVEQLLSYLQDNIQNELMGIVEEKLQPAKLFFTITANGTIEHIEVQRTSGYERIDTKLKVLIKTTEKNWQPAKNSLGIPVDQELVISYGAMGC